jgi:predicted nucleic acid-binding protein
VSADVFVLDTSAWMALDEREDGWEEVDALLTDAWDKKVRLHGCFVTLTEPEYIRTQEVNAEQAAEILTFVRSQPVTWHHSDAALCSSAAKVKAGHKLSFADSFIAALTQRLDATLVHKDPEFSPLAGVLKQRMLPPKTRLV